MSERRLLIISGWGNNSACWDEARHLLANEFEVSLLTPHNLLYDGGTYADGLASIVRSSDLPCSLLGWSMGGIIALETLLKGDCVAEKLVLVGSTPSFVVRDDFPSGTPAENLRAFSLAVKRKDNDVLSKFFRNVFAPAVLSEDALSVCFEELNAVSEQALLAGLDYLQGTDLRASLSELKGEIFVVHGTKDRVIPIEAGQYLQESIEGALGCFVQDAGHAMFAEDPKLFVERVIEFLL